MTYEEKIRIISDQLRAVADPLSKKGIYSVPDLARAIYLRCTGCRWKNIPTTANYVKITAYSYWYGKLKKSGRLAEIMKII